MAGEADAVELEVLEYLTGMAGLGLEKKAQAIYLRALVRDVRPLLMEQKRMLGPQVFLAEAGLAVDASVDARALAVEARLATAWGRCLEQLQTLWLTEGRADDAA